MSLTTSLKDFSFNPIFFVVLTISTHLISEVLPCEYRKELLSNVFAKHLILFMVIFFVVNDEKSTAIKELQKAIIYYIVFLFFAKAPLIFSLIMLVVLAVGIFIQRIISDKKAAKKDIKKEEKFVDFLKYVFIGLVLVGFLIALDSNINQPKFDFINFIFNSDQVCLE